MSLDLDFNTRALVTVLDRLEDTLLDRAGEALNDEHQTIMKDAKAHCPVDTGDLRNSGEVFEPVVNRREVVSSGAFGGDAKTGQYAITVHESVHVPHRIGEAKWYQNALERATRGMADRIARKVFR